MGKEFQTLEEAEVEIDNLRALLNHPEFEDFLVGVKREAAHQILRWGIAEDRRKSPADWFWLLGYLAGKALASCLAGDRQKALHHCISSAAVLLNWHWHIRDPGLGSLTGKSDLVRDLEKTFGPLEDM